MAKVTVLPEEFTFISFDGAAIQRIAEEVADEVGLPAGYEVEVEVDQTSPFGYNQVTPRDGGARILVESGAFENPKKPRTLSEEGTRSFLARIFFRLRDRLDEGFGSPPPDEDLTYEQRTAWDTYGVGRWVRLGHDGGKARRQYHFRLRHGFNDVADAVFERLWTSDGLSWEDVEKACAETAEAKAAVLESRAS